MRKILLVVLCVLLLITAVACGKNNKTDIAVDTAGNIIGETTADTVSNIDTAEEYTEIVGEYMLPIEGEMSFYNGTEDGSFANSLIVSQDGSFYGSYYELDKNLTGDNYQNGTYYWNTYWGEFTDIIWLDESTFSMKLSSLATEREDGKERFEDDSFKSITTTELKGLSKETEYILFLPNTPIHMLPEEVVNSIKKDISTQETLDMYVLFNTEEQNIFICEE